MVEILGLVLAADFCWFVFVAVQIVTQIFYKAVVYKSVVIHPANTHLTNHWWATPRAALFYECCLAWVSWFL